jgi:inhibitor of KinA sporulation pathway (predicted exonuclease)
LTRITQDLVDVAPGFSEVMARFAEWLGGSHQDFLFCSWGDYDRKQFEQDCRFHCLGWPFPTGHLNLKKAFSRAMGRKLMGMARALALLGLPLEGAHHRGIDDACNIAGIVRATLGTIPHQQTWQSADHAERPPNEPPPTDP